jgi:hypothetical protein
VAFLTTLGLFAATVLLAAACGYGIVTWLLPAEWQEEHAPILMAPVGYAVYSWFAFTLSGTFDLSGRATTAIAGVVFLAVGLSAWWKRGRFAPSRRALPRVVGLSATAMLFTLWPLFYMGADTYLAAVNPDFTATLVDLHFLEDHPLDADPTGKPDTDSYFHSVVGTLGKSARFGCSYFALLTHAVLRVPMRTALTLCVAAFVFCIPLSVYFFARVGLGLSRRAAALASAFVGTSAATTMSYVYFYVGQNSGLGVLPVALTLLYLAFRSPSWRLCALATLVLNGLYCTYTGMFLYAVAPAAVAAVYLALEDRTRIAPSVLRAAVMLGASIVLNAGNAPILSAAFLGWSKLVTQAPPRQFFIDFLTEQFVPIFLGIVSYPIGASAQAGWLAKAGFVRLYEWSAVLTLMVLFAVAHWARRSEEKSRVILGLAAALLYAAAWYVFTFRQQYGYAAFKMCSWLQFLYAVALGYGLDASLNRALARGAMIARLAAATTLGIFAAAFAANVVSAHHLTRVSLGTDTLRGMIVNVFDMSGNRDVEDLPITVGSLVKPYERIGVRLTDTMQNQWAAYYLRSARTSLLGHHMIPSVEEDLPDVVTRIGADRDGQAAIDHNPYFHGSEDDYYLTWSGGYLNQEIVEQQLPQPVWESRSFRLLRASEVRDLLFTGRGWYRVEFRHLWECWWPARFRWTAQGGEVYLLRASRPGEAYRLSFVGIVGYGRPSDRRVIELWHDGVCFDEIEMRSAARVVSRPFYPSGDGDRLVIRVRESVHQLPRAFSLWNKDVPADYRRLNLLVSEVRVLPPGAPSGAAAPRRLSGEMLFVASTSFNGIQPNRWVAGSFSVSYRRPPGSERVALSLFVPGHPRLHFPMALVGTLDDRPFRIEVAQPGALRSVLPLGPPSPGGIVSIQAGVGQEYAPDTQDGETHPIHESFRVESVTFE